ncbi:MAG: SDR family NAD(P)-dependent oxidoreductase [Mangrovibacterium sp.]
MAKTGLVTGAASGLGFEFSNLLAQDSFDLVLVDVDEQKLLATKQKIRDIYPVHVETIICDLCQPGCVVAIYEQLEGRNIDILINNAGFGLYGFFSKTEWELEESMIYLHILTLTHLTKLILKDMINVNNGKILNVSSVAAFQPGPLMAVYYATKAYILSFSEALSNEVKGTGVSVTVLTHHSK